MNLAIIQARMNSSRLPGKVLRKVGDELLIDIIIKRIKLTNCVDKIIVATTTQDSDDILVEHLIEQGVEIYRGSENNVLDRFYKAAKKYEATNIIRITADDPLKDASIIDQLIIKLINDNFDYVSNTINPTYPEGLDVEVFTLEALENAYFNAILNSEKEHVTPYIWKNGNKFKTYNQEFHADLSSWRWTIDKHEDLIFFEEIYRIFGSLSGVSCMELISYIDNNPNMLLINNNSIRNEGYIKSIGEENVNK